MWKCFKICLLYFILSVSTLLHAQHTYWPDSYFHYYYSKYLWCACILSVLYRTICRDLLYCVIQLASDYNNNTLYDLYHYNFFTVGPYVSVYFNHSEYSARESDGRVAVAIVASRYYFYKSFSVLVKASVNTRLRPYYGTV